MAKSVGFMRQQCLGIHSTLIFQQRNPLITPLIAPLRELPCSIFKGEVLSGGKPERNPLRESMLVASLIDASGSLRFNIVQGRMKVIIYFSSPA